MSKYQVFSIQVGETDVSGEITHRSEADIAVRITKPFEGLSNACHIPYFSRPTNSFKTEYGDQMAANLLQYLFELGVYIRDHQRTIRLQLAAHFPDANYSSEHSRGRFFTSTFPFNVPLELREEVLNLLTNVDSNEKLNEHRKGYIPIRKLKPVYTHDDRNKQGAIVSESFDLLTQALQKYMDIWKQVGGGTTGYAIDAVQRLVDEAKLLFKNKC